MPRENAQAKARRYLTEGRLMIKLLDPVADRVRAHCRGGGHVYNLGYEPGEGWFCECAALSECCHLIALQLVTVRPQGGH